jgi:glycosyltransferase involved in cell wall biosynthesis
MREFSIIIPVYNRPNEIDELLQSLTKQTFIDFEVIVVEDGSREKADEICKKYSSSLDIKYFLKENQGPGETRNYGCRRATSNFFIFFDSDCLIPENYLSNLSNAQKHRQFDAYGGPDTAAGSFTPVQKAINYSMTSVFTTGGIRGGKSSVEKFHPRSFNMGISRKVFEKTNGFSPMRYGEDIDFSIRIAKAGFTLTLLQECFVYHKRRTNFRDFFNQTFNSGKARINLYKRHPESLKSFHFFPSIFTVYLFIVIPSSLLYPSFIPLIPLAGYLLLIFLHASITIKNFKAAFLSVWATIVQLCGYGMGFIYRFPGYFFLQK